MESKKRFVRRSRSKTAAPATTNLTNNNDKVRIQYIHSQRAEEGDQQYTSGGDEPIAEMENAEFLDVDGHDGFSDGFDNECSAQVKFVDSSDDEEEKSTFYINAVDCLIDLYRLKYDQMTSKSPKKILSMGIWEQIAEEMNESYFDFSPEKVKRTFTKLREQYFAIGTEQDKRSFKFFHQIHEIYQDKRIESLKVEKSGSPQERYEYDDEILFRNEGGSREVETISSETEDNQNSCINTTSQDHQDADGQESVVDQKPRIMKRAIQGVDVSPSEPEAKHSKLAMNQPLVESYNPHQPADMTLSEFNTQEERRHQESLELLRKLLAMQEASHKLQADIIRKLEKINK